MRIKFFLGPMISDDPETIQLAGRLEALASPLRLKLLQKLQTPLTVSEIELARNKSGLSGGTASRQAVKKHLDKLGEVALIDSREVERVWGKSTEYFVNHQTLFSIAEDLRDLAVRRATVEPQAPTMPTSPPAAGVGRGPRLVIVRGLREGQSYALEGPGPWMIGRKRGLDISLDYDPFASSENTEVFLRRSTLCVRQVPGSRNGTSVNFEPLGRAEERELRHGDLVRVGRTHLLYWT